MVATDRCVVTIRHENPIIAMGIAAMLARHPDITVADAKPTSQQNADVAVCSYQHALEILGRDRPPVARQVLIVTDADQECVVSLALKAGARGYLLMDSCAEELVNAVRAVGRGLHYVCRAVAPSIATSLAQDPLTGRESDVLLLLVDGLANKQIAARLDIGVGTVKSHVKAILEKLGAATRTEAASLAMRRGLVTTDYAGTSNPREGRRNFSVPKEVPAARPPRTSMPCAESRCAPALNGEGDAGGRWLYASQRESLRSEFTT
jgi:DNA-binding NarL/FixJ family response regulator